MDHQEIPILDLRPGIDSQWNELTTALQDVLRSGSFILGPKVKQFESEVGAFLGTHFAIGLNSGTDALFLALRALNVGPGDEVITTPFTFFATAEAISHVGATPVFADILPRSFNIDPAEIEKKMTSKTKAILPVHLFGQAADMTEIMKTAKSHDVAVVEDVAQAFGGKYKGKRTGTFGAFGTFSFFPSKNLGTFGDGGLVVTDRTDLADKVRMLRAHGSRKKYYNEVVGYNSRLDELHAAILLVRLAKIEEWNEGRRQAAFRYHEMLESVRNVQIPIEDTSCHHVYHQYTIRVKDVNRDELQKKLAAEGIGTMVYYPVPLHQLPIYQAMGVSCPVAEEAAKEVISLPIWPEIDAETQKRVTDTLKKYL